MRTNKPAEPLADSLCLSGPWRFATDSKGVGQDAGWAGPAFDDTAWTGVEVPHTWNVMPEHLEYEGRAWYRHTFDAPATAADGHARLRFEGAYYLAHVWLNGHYLGQHEGGFTPFELDASEHLYTDRENVLAVQVDNLVRQDRIPTPPMGWYPYGGIVRDVSLEITGRAYVAHQRIVAVPQLTAEDEADAAAITATVWVRNTAGEPLEGTLTGDVAEDAGEDSVLQARPRAAIHLGPGETASVTLQTKLAGPKLWHFDHPHLYRWTATLTAANGKVLHADEVTFGVRSVALRDGRLVLNGEPVRLVGFTRHQDSPECGTAETVARMKADYDDMKQLNMVLSRPVHYPQPAYILDYCDRNGILIIPEIPAWQLKTWQMADANMRALERQQLREMIESEWNHPSVWAWSVANEIDSNTAEGRAFVRDMAAYVHEIDSTRPVSFASDRLGQGPWRDACADFLLMNAYYGMWHGPKDAFGAVLEMVHAAWPDKVLFISEWGFSSQWQETEPPPNYDPARYYHVPQGTPPDAPEVDAVRCRHIADQMPVLRSKPFVAGCVYWTYQDYLVPVPRVEDGRAPSAMFVMGVVDAERGRRGSWYALRDEYAPLCIEPVALGPASGDRRRATVSLRARGPLEEDLPVYTLRGYRLRWTVTEGERTLAQGTIDLPTLPPAAVWRGDLVWPAPEGKASLTLEVIRPTGFVALERWFETI
jgi:beta-glucuronidase